MQHGAISPDPTGTIPAHSGQIFTLSGVYGLRAMLRDILEPTHGGDTLNVLSRNPALEAMFLRNFQPHRFRIYFKKIQSAGTHTTICVWGWCFIVHSMSQCQRIAP